MSKLWQPVDQELFTKLARHEAELTAIALDIVDELLGFKDDSARHAATFSIKKAALDTMAGGWQFYEVSSDPVENLKNFRLFQAVVNGDPVRNFINLVSEWKEVEPAHVGSVLEKATKLNITRPTFHKVADYWLLAQWLFDESGELPGLN